MTNLYDLDKRLNTCSSSERQASVRSVKLRSTTLCPGVFLFYIKRHLMSGNEFACSLGSSSAKIAWVWTQQTRWKTLANNVRRYSSRCVRAFRDRQRDNIAHRRADCLHSVPEMAFSVPVRVRFIYKHGEPHERACRNTEQFSSAAVMLTQRE